MRTLNPPLDLAGRALPLENIGISCFRLRHERHKSAIFWSKLGIYRFDSRRAPFGVLYTAGTLEGAALEVFGDQWIDRRIMSQESLRRYRLSVLIPADPVLLVDTTGANLNKLSVDSSLFASLDYRMTRRWAKAFMTHPANAQGFIYHSRKNPELLNYAYFVTDQMIGNLAEQDEMALEDAPGLGDFLDGYEVRIV
jgi:RES domain-containing protein